jgi:quinol monooxygenase YgiN
MSISLGVAAVGALASLVFTGMLVRRFIRVPRMAALALIFATAALTVALAAQAVGYHRGFGETTFRAVQLGARLVAPLALTWALAELTAKSLGARFAARLGLGALTVVGAVVLATDPLNSASFSKSWPSASVHYQLIPNWVLEAVAVVTALSAVAAVIVAGIRARRSDGWRALLLAVAAVAVAVVALDCLRLALPVHSGYPLLCLGASVLAWFGGVRASTVRLESLRSGGYSWDEDTGSFSRYHDDSGEFAATGDTGGYGRDGGETDGRDWRSGDTGGYGRDEGATDARGWHADDTGGFRRDPADTDFSGWFRPGDDTGSFRRDPADTGGFHQDPPGPADTGGLGRDPADTGGPGRDPADTGGMGSAAADTGYSRYGLVPPPGPDQSSPGQLSPGQNGMGARRSVAYVETGDVMPVLGKDGYPAPPQVPLTEDTSRLYGQIAIYTLLDEAAEDFERLASEVVEQVKTREPDTLVYVMHGVPAAPMQRILYAVYRDEAAFDEHERQPYIRQFEEEREPYVLATNVIELGVRHGKFAPATPPKRAPRARKVRPRSSSGRSPAG